MIAGNFDNLKVGDDFKRHHRTEPWLVMGNVPTRYSRDNTKPWVVFKIFSQEEQAILREIERMHDCPTVENLFASNVVKMRTPVYSAS
jgi:hypothetical protein